MNQVIIFQPASRLKGFAAREAVICPEMPGSEEFISSQIERQTSHNPKTKWWQQ